MWRSEKNILKLLNYRGDAPRLDFAGWFPPLAWESIDDYLPVRMFKFKVINYEIEKLLGIEEPRQPPDYKVIKFKVGRQFDNPKWDGKDPQIPTGIWKDWKQQGRMVWPSDFATTAFEADKKMAKMIEQYIKFVENRIIEMKKIDEKGMERALAVRKDAYPEQAINSATGVGTDLYWWLKRRLEEMKVLMNNSEVLYNPSIYKLYQEYEKDTNIQLETLLEGMEGEDWLKEKVVSDHFLELVQTARLA